MPFRLQLKLKGSNQLIFAWINIVQQHLMYVAVDGEDRIQSPPLVFLEKTGFKTKELK